MKGTMADYQISAITETAIMDIYPYEAEADIQPEFEDSDYKKLSAAARLCHKLAISGNNGNKYISSTPITVLNSEYGYGNGTKLIQQLVRKGVLVRENEAIRVVDKPLETFDWYIKQEDSNEK